MRGDTDGIIFTDKLIFNDFEIEENDVVKKLEFKTNGTNCMTMDTNCDITMTGNLSVSGTILGARRIANTDDTTSITTDVAGLFASEALIFKTAGNEVARIDALGFLGIGTTSPAGQLDVNGLIICNTLQGTLTTVAQPNITSVGTLSSLTVSGNIGGTLTTVAQPNITSVGTLSSLTVSGNIGGTLTTVAQPNITSVGNLNDLTILATIPEIRITDNRTVITSSNTTLGELVFWSNDVSISGGGKVGAIVAKSQDTTTGFPDGKIIFETYSDGVKSGDMILDKNGNLDISGNLIAINGTLSSLNVGAGTANIEVKGSNSGVDANLKLARGSATSYQISNDGGNFEISQYTDGVGTLTDFYRYVGNSHRLSVNGTEVFRVNSNGNIGLSNTNPQYELDVGGNCNITGNYLKNGVKANNFLQSRIDISGGTGGTNAVVTATVQLLYGKFTQTSLGGAPPAWRYNQTFNWNEATLLDVDVDSLVITAPVEMGRYEVTISGYYRINANILWDSNSTGVRQLEMKKNGTSTQIDSKNATTGNTTSNNINTTIFMTSGNYFDLYAYQTSGGNLSYTQSFVEITRLS